MQKVWLNAKQKAQSGIKVRLEAEFKVRPEAEHKGRFKQCAVCFCLQVASHGLLPSLPWMHQPSRPLGLLQIRRRPSRPLSLLRMRFLQVNIIWDPES